MNLCEDFYHLIAWEKLKYETYYTKCQMLFMGSNMYLKLIIIATSILNVVIGNKYPPQPKGLRKTYIAGGIIASVGNYQIVDILLSTSMSDDQTIFQLDGLSLFP